ncbi:MAG: TetR/AcrR family transcriptional regulator [Acidimicrobiaceae bacterium]|nr:TetR/AcrR family transcriptional regulator [Acidimicrobiaceae bacterium]
MVQRDDRPIHVERREQLLEIAKHVFAERGYQATTMEDIAKAAGFTKPILYQHFESKSMLYREIVAHTGAILVENLMKAITSVTTPRSKIESAFRVYFEMVVNDTDAFRLLFIHSHEGETASELRKIEVSLVGFLVPYIDVSIGHDHRRQLAAGIVGIAEGAAIVWLLQQEAKGWPTPPPDEAKRLAAHSATLAWGGLRAVHKD